MHVFVYVEGDFCFVFVFCFDVSFARDDSGVFVSIAPGNGGSISVFLYVALGSGGEGGDVV